MRSQASDAYHHYMPDCKGGSAKIEYWFRWPPAARKLSRFARPDSQGLSYIRLE